MLSESGTNQFHGSVFEYIRNHAFDARNAFEVLPTSVVAAGKRLPPFQRNQFGGAFGGPIRKDKTFFFAVFEGLREHLGTTPASGQVVPAAGCRAAAGTQLTNAMCPQLNLPASVPSITVAPLTPLLMSVIPLPNAAGNTLVTPFTQPTTRR